MSANIFYEVKTALSSRLPHVLHELLPGGKLQGHEYVCASLEGGEGTSCSTNIDTGKGSDFATGEAWGDIIALAAKVWNVRQFEAAKKLAEQYGLECGSIANNKDAQRRTQRDAEALSSIAPYGEQLRKPQTDTDISGTTQTNAVSSEFVAMYPIPSTAPMRPHRHKQYGIPIKLWSYTDNQGRPVAHTARFETPQGKVVLPLTYGKQGGIPKWAWKALPEPRPLYNLHELSQGTKPILIVEGEKTAEAAKVLFPSYIVTTWSGGAQAVHKADWSVLQGRSVIIWPDNDKAGRKAALDIASVLQSIAQAVLIVDVPSNVPEKWDLADAIPMDFDIQKAVQQAILPSVFKEKHTAKIQVMPTLLEVDELPLKSWPQFSWASCPGLLGDFVKLATRDSEADPAAVCITTLVRFAAEVYAFAEKRGPHIYVGETAHPPRLFAVICGNSSKARKGTSRYPVATLFGRDYCDEQDLRSWKVCMPAKESGGPLSTGEGLAFHVREETEEERTRHQKNNPHLPLRDKADKRLLISDEEFATALSCIKREGNTLSMGIRCFWDSGDYAPLTKNNPITVKGAHINIITHITMQELALCLDEVQAVNGFGNRFLWICARRSKLVALPPRMPEVEIALMQRELWRLVGLAQNRGLMKMDTAALEVWRNVYPELSKEHNGFAGSIINRAEAQTLRLALVYALLDGQDHIAEPHLQAALSLWTYAQESALYIFKDKGDDPLEAKILAALQGGALSATELSHALQRHVSRERLQPLLQRLEAQQKITITKEKGLGRPRTLLALCSSANGCEKKKLSEKSEFSEKRGAHE